MSIKREGVSIIFAQLPGADWMENTRILGT